MLKFFRLPFATTGDKTAVPDAVDSNGNVSYSQGYGFDYQRQKTDPAAKNIERDKMNQILFDITTAIAEIQSKGGADFITSALNGGTAYSYGQGAIVNYGGAWYISLAAANTALPTDATKWAYLPTPALLQQAAFMSAVAGGTVDAITAAFTPAIAALPAAPGTLSVFVRAGGANTTTIPTFKADGTAAKTIVKGANQALVAGDIAGAGHWLELQYDATLDKWVLQNPAYGINNASAGNFAGLNSYNASATLSLSDIGKLVTFYGSTAAQTLTLPAVATVAVGKNFIIVNQASVAVTIKGNAAENISRNVTGVGQTLSNTVALNSGDSLVLSSNGTNQWNAKGQSAPDMFPNSKATNGYQKLPNGLILQWGVTTLTGGASYTTVTLPIAYTTTNFGVYGNAVENVGSVTSEALEFGARGLTSFEAVVLSGTAPNNSKINWISVGY